MAGVWQGLSSLTWCPCVTETRLFLASPSPATSYQPASQSVSQPTQLQPFNHRTSVCWRCGRFHWLCGNDRCTCIGMRLRFWLASSFMAPRRPHIYRRPRDRVGFVARAARPRSTNPPRRADDSAKSGKGARKAQI